MPDLPWLVYAFPFAFIALIAFAAGYKYLEVRAAADWPSTQGKVVVSTSQRRKVKTFDDNRAGGRGEEERNFAKIIYEYNVSGQKLRNDRVSIGEDLGNFEVAETIARYPVGSVVTVYYNPRRPREAVLERDAPKGVWGCVIALVVIGSGLILGSFFGFNQLTEFVRGHMTNPHRAAMVVALCAMALVTVWIAATLSHHARQARRWPLVTARITRSEVDRFEGRLKQDTALRTLYRPIVTYEYAFNGIAYSGDSSSLGGKVTSSSDSYAKKTVAKFPLGSSVQVHVNPQNPSEALLRPSARFTWPLFAIAAVLLGLAWFVSQQP